MSTGNETWIHHFQPETKLQFREWNQSHDFTTQEVQDSFLSRVSDGNCLLGHGGGDFGQYYRDRNNKFWGICCYPAENSEVHEES